MSVTDLWFAYYLRSKGFKLTSFKQIQRGKCTFEFEISAEDYAKIRLEYLDSDVIKIKLGIDELKELSW